MNQHCGIPGQSGARVSLVAAACLMLGSIKAIRYLCDTSDSHRVSGMRFIAFNILLPAHVFACLFAHFTYSASLHTCMCAGIPGRVPMRCVHWRIYWHLAHAACR